MSNGFSSKGSRSSAANALTISSGFGSSVLLIPGVSITRPANGIVLNRDFEVVSESSSLILCVSGSSMKNLGNPLARFSAVAGTTC